MDFNFKVSGVMDVDVTQYSVFNETEDGLFEWEKDGRLYNLVVAVEVFDQETGVVEYIVGDDNLSARGFDIHDYSDIQWEVKNQFSEISSEGVSLDELG